MASVTDMIIGAWHLDTHINESWSVTDHAWSNDSGSGTLTTFDDGTSANENHPSLAANDSYTYTSKVNDSSDTSIPTYSTSASLNSAYSDTYSSAENASAWERYSPSAGLAGASTFTVTNTDVASTRNSNSGNMSQQQGQTYTSNATWSNTDDLNVNYSNSGGQAIGNGASIAWDSYQLSLSDHATYTLSRRDTAAYTIAEPVVGPDGIMTTTLVPAGTYTSWNGTHTGDLRINVQDSTGTPLSGYETNSDVDTLTLAQGNLQGADSVVTVSGATNSSTITDDGAGNETTNASDDSSWTTTTTYSDGTTSVTSGSLNSAYTSTGSSTLTDAFANLFILPAMLTGGSGTNADVWLLGGDADLVAPGTSLPTSGSTSGGTMMPGPSAVSGPSFSSFGGGQLVAPNANGGAGPTLGAGASGLATFVAGGANADGGNGSAPLTMGTSADDASGGSSDDLATAIGDAPIWGYLTQTLQIADEALDPLDAPVRGAITGMWNKQGEGVGSFVRGAVLGDLDDSNTWSAQAGQIAIGFAPVLGQLADIRDLGVALYGVWQGKEGAEIDLAFALIAFIPFYGDTAKATGKGLRRAAGNAAEGATQRFAKETAQNASSFAKPARGAAGNAAQDAAKALDDVPVHTPKAPQLSCFPAGTLVASDNGPKPIESIVEGQFVWAYDLVASDWRLRRVLRAYSRPCEGLAASVTVGGETIVSTLLHPYFVVRGEDLDNRPRLQHLAEVPEGATTPGRWVDARDLRADDELILIDGRTARIEQIRLYPFFDTVYNFEVDDLHCYAVGRSGILVHNNNGEIPGPNAKVPRFEGPKPRYTVNPAHVPGTLRKGKTPLPADAEDVFRRAVPDDPVNPRNWFGQNANGQTYRFSGGNDGTAHFSGIDGVGDGVRNLTKYARQRLKELSL